MGIDSFAEDVKENVKKKLGKGCEVTVRKVGKNNGIVCTGLCVTEDRASLSPLIYIDSHYDSYKKGNTTPAHTADYVADTYRQRRTTVDMRRLLDYESVKNSIIYKLVNTAMNAELLEDLPHLEFLDLSVVFLCLVEDRKIGTATILIHNAHTKLWGVSVGELHSAAVRNTPKLLGYEVKSIGQVMCEIMPEKSFPEDFEHSVPLYLLSNRERSNGAACILYPNLLKDFAEALGSSFYIIPSSVHEVLLLPADITDNSTELRELIKEVNDTEVIPEEILSYSLYYYDQKMDEVRIAA